MRIAEYGSAEAIFLAISPHPFDPFISQVEPILIQTRAPLESDEVIGAQLTFDAVTDKPIVYYTSANHKTGWWVMMASPI